MEYAGWGGHMQADAVAMRAVSWCLISCNWHLSLPPFPSAPRRLCTLFLPIGHGIYRKNVAVRATPLPLIMLRILSGVLRQYRCSWSSGEAMPFTNGGEPWEMDNVLHEAPEVCNNGRCDRCPVCLATGCLVWLSMPCPTRQRAGPAIAGLLAQFLTVCRRVKT